MNILSAAITLLLVMDPLGNIPAFLTILKDVDPSRRNWIILRESVIALFILLFFLLVGPAALRVMHIEQPALSMAGGIILFLISIRMIFPQKDKLFVESPEGEPLIVPLATPLIAGPSAMAAVLLLVAQEPGRIADWALAIGLAWIVTAATLFVSSPISRLLGVRGLMAVERLMGMILTTIAVQMFLNGLQRFLAG